MTNYSILSKSGFGLSELFGSLEDIRMNQSYPPYNIIKVNDFNYILEIAVAGFNKDEITIETKENRLKIFGSKEKSNEQPNYIHKGISSRDFKMSFGITDDVVINNAKLINGILSLEIERIIPEEKKPKIIEIN